MKPRIYAAPAIKGLNEDSFSLLTYTMIDFVFAEAIKEKPMFTFNMHVDWSCVCWSDSQWNNLVNLNVNCF